MRFCRGKQLLDKVAIKILHDSIGLLSLEQRTQKQLLNLMFNQANNGGSREITNVNTRRQAKYVFKLDSTMGGKYQKSLFFLGTRLWDNFDKET